EMIGPCPCTSTPNFPMWTRLFRLLQDIGDVRMRKPLEEKLAGPRWSGSFYQVLFPRIKKTLDDLREPDPLPDADASLVEKLADGALALATADPSAPLSLRRPKPGSGKTEEELLAMVYDDPESDGPRVVYGDWLLERADPRGELMTLQLKRAREGLSKAEA